MNKRGDFFAFFPRFFSKSQNGTTRQHRTAVPQACFSIFVANLDASRRGGFRSMIKRVRDFSAIFAIFFAVFPDHKICRNFQTRFFPHRECEGPMRWAPGALTCTFSVLHACYHMPPSIPQPMGFPSYGRVK